MDTTTSRHGLSSVLTATAAEQQDALSPELQKALQSLEELFTVDAAKLKQISERFGEELQEGALSVDPPP